MKNTLPFVDNPLEQRYEFDLDGDRAVIDYRREPGAVILTHTYVPPRHEGRGFGAAMVRSVLEDIRAKGLCAVPQCSFVAVYIRRHPEWESLVRREEPVR